MQIPPGKNSFERAVSSRMSSVAAVYRGGALFSVIGFSSDERRLAEDFVRATQSIDNAKKS